MNMEWQPIETAPKDGTRILASGMTFGSRIVILQWGPTTYNRSTRNHNYGWSQPAHGVVYDPTHWMPLPEPPTQDQ